METQKRRRANWPRACGVASVNPASLLDLQWRNQVRRRDLEVYGMWEGKCPLA